jgi:hypothetical protein
MTPLMDWRTGRWTVSVSLCYLEMVVLRDRRLPNFSCFNVNRKSGEEFTRVIPLKYFTPCDEVNKTSILINIKYSEPFWVKFY